MTWLSLIVILGLHLSLSADVCYVSPLCSPAPTDQRMHYVATKVTNNFTNNSIKQITVQQHNNYPRKSY